MMQTICVVGASGGVGASCVAAAVALELGRRVAPSVLVDLDLISGGADVVAGIDHQPGVRWSSLAGVRGHVDAAAVFASLPGDSDTVVLAADGGRHSAGRFGAAQRAVLDALRASHRPVVLDVPRWLVLDALAEDDLLLVVSGTRARQLADFDALVSRMLDTDDGPAAPADRMRLLTCGPRPPGELIDVIQTHTGVRWIGHVPHGRRIAREHERGEWPGWSGPLRHTAISVVDEVIDQSRAA